MAKRVAEVIVESLIAAGVKRVYGVPGDSLNGITDSIRARREDISWVHVRHEETASFAAGAEAHLTGRLTACAGSCGPGNTHLINGLYDCHKSRVPVLAIAAQIPSREIGSGYFQETHPELIFKECSFYCELVSSPEQIPRILEHRDADCDLSPWGFSRCNPRGHSSDGCGLPPGDDFYGTLEAGCVSLKGRESAETTEILNSAQRVTILAGAGCEGAHAELIEAAGLLQAPIVHTIRGKEFIEHDNPFDVGDDRTARILFGLSRDDGLGCAVDARHGLSIPAVLSRPRQGGPSRLSGRADRAKDEGGSWVGRRCERDPPLH